MESILFHPYILIGIISCLFMFKRIAKGFANRKYSSPGFFKDKDEGVEPDIGDYLAILLWTPSIICLWPLVLAYYLWEKC